MNRYLAIAAGVTFFIASYLYFANARLSERIADQDNVIRGLNASLQRTEDAFRRNLAAIEQKRRSDGDVYEIMKLRKEACYGDEKAAAIIAVGVPDCLR